MAMTAGRRPAAVTTVVFLTMVTFLSAGTTGDLSVPNIFTINNGDQVELKAWQQYQGSVLINVLHFEAHVVGSPITTGADEVRELLKKVFWDVGSFGQLVRECQVEDLVWTHATGQMIFPARLPYLQPADTAPGALAEPGAPSNVDAVIKKRSSTVGRGRTGAVHIGGIPLSGLDGAFLTVPYQADITTAAGAMVNDINMVTSGAFWRPVVGPKKSMMDPENWLISATADREARVMVRRTAFRGI